MKDFPRIAHGFTPQQIRKFWQQAFCAALSGLYSTGNGTGWEDHAATCADIAVDEWLKRFAPKTRSNS